MSRPAPRPYNLSNAVGGASFRFDVRRARERQKGLSATVEGLQQARGIDRGPMTHHDLDVLIGTWVEDAAFVRAREDFERVDAEIATW